MNVSISILGRDILPVTYITISGYRKLYIDIQLKPYLQDLMYAITDTSSRFLSTTNRKWSYFI